MAEIIEEVAGAIVDYVHGSERLNIIAEAAILATLDAIREPSDVIRGDMWLEVANISGDPLSLDPLWRAGVDALRRELTGRFRSCGS